MAFPFSLRGLGTARDTEESTEPTLWLVSGSGSCQRGVGPRVADWEYCHQLRLPASWIQAGNVCGMSAQQGSAISPQAKVQFTSQLCRFDLCDHTQHTILYSLSLPTWSSGSKYGFWMLPLSKSQPCHLMCDLWPQT